MTATWRIGTFCCLLMMPLLLMAVPATDVHAAPSLPSIADRDSIPSPPDPDRLTFYLLTVDTGDHVWDNFGHTALRVIDTSNGTDLVFNWGLFDASAGLLPFGWRFLQGDMEYQLGTFPTEWELSRYRREQRTVWQERINLTAPQKTRLYRRLAWNLRDENVSYDYDYFRDNCTTRVRDYLDEALSGALYEATQGRGSGSWREQVRAHYRSLPPVALGVDVLLNGRVDAVMSRWESLFLPLQLRQQLQRVASDVEQDGSSLPLLSDTQILMEFDAPPDRGNGYLYFSGLLLPIGLLMLAIRRVPISLFSTAAGYQLMAAGVSYRLLGLLGLLLALVSGGFGSLMLFAWLGSSHEDLHGNLNLLLFWPTDLLLIGYAVRWLVLGRAVTIGTGRYQWVVAYLMLHGLAGIVYLGVSAFSEQNVGALLLYVLPVLVLFGVVTGLAGFRVVRPIRFS